MTSAAVATVVAPRLGSDDVVEYWAAWRDTGAADEDGVKQFFYDLSLLHDGPATTYYYEASVGDKPGQARSIWSELIQIGFSQPVRTQPVQVPVLINHFSGEITGFAKRDGSLLVPLYPAG